MGHIIVKQPNGKFTIWSTIVDCPIAVDLDMDEVCSYEAQSSYESTYEYTKRHIERGFYQKEDFFESKEPLWENIGVDDPDCKELKQLFDSVWRTQNEN